MTPPTDIDSCSSAKTASLSPSPSPSPSSLASPAPSSLLPSAPPAPAFVPWALASALASALRVSRPSSPRMALAIAARDRSAVSRTFGSAAAAAADDALDEFCVGVGASWVGASLALGGVSGQAIQDGVEPRGGRGNRLLLRRPLGLSGVGSRALRRRSRGLRLRRRRRHVLLPRHCAVPHARRAVRRAAGGAAAKHLPLCGWLRRMVLG
mmetsp:Transcript_35008/g.105254  ORF Transcript_35008/g.105254 Transcript_35008/m.105254 type:complete len:210 (+) Transcript_35008:462-1091(+)